MNPKSTTTWQPRGLTNPMAPEALQGVHSQQSTLVMAGPGSGKTELLAQRASFLLETGACPVPQRILAISFKRDAAYNLRERVRRRCGPKLAERFDSYTFDGWGKGLLDRFRLALPPELSPTANYEVAFALTEERNLRNLLRAGCAAAGVARERIEGASKERLQQFFSTYVLGYALYPAAASTSDQSLLALAQYFWHTALHAGSRSKLEFSMISALAQLLLRTNNLLVLALRNTYGTVFLDEFQDTTTLQYQLLLAAFQGSSATLTAVGDTKQRIMLWAGASSQVFKQFNTDFGAQTVRLAINYRSAPRLVAIQQHLINALDRDSPQVQPANIWEPHEGECRILAYPDNNAEATHLAQLMGEWLAQGGITPSEICVIVRQRTAEYTRSLQQALIQLGVHSQVQDTIQDLRTEPLAVMVVDAFRWCTATQAPKSWQTLLARYLRARGVEDVQLSVQKTRSITEELTRFLTLLRPRLLATTTTAEVEGLIRDLLGFLGEAAFCLTHEQYRQPAFLHKTVIDCARQLALTRTKHADWEAALDEFSGIHAIPMMTIHKSKGLEYHTVIFLGLEDYPFFGIGEGTDEEECNFFVAFSRAKKRVVFTHCATRFNAQGIGTPQTRTAVDGLFQLLSAAGVQEDQPLVAAAAESVL